MYVRGYVSNTQGESVPAFTIGTVGGNYTSGVFDIPSAYRGPDAYTVRKQISDSSNPTFGYLLVTVYTDNTWGGEFRGSTSITGTTSPLTYMP